METRKLGKTNHMSSLMALLALGYRDLTASLVSRIFYYRQCEGAIPD